MPEQASGELDSAYEALNPLCAKVGFTRTGQLPLIDSVATADGVALWSSAYARLLLWPCRASDPQTIATTARTAQRWFDEVLILGERARGGLPIDGYLVLALPSPPADDAREDVRRLELSAQVCRKHLIWPSLPTDSDHADVRWQRIADITVIGLPEAGIKPSEELQWPEIDTEAKDLWEEIDAMGVSALLILDDST